MNCPHCARIVAKDLARCPYCGTNLRAAYPGGSAILRPQSELLDGYRETPLADHEHALRRLRAAWRNAHVGYGQLVSLVGENGSGRSRLIREVGTTIDEEAPQARWLVGQAFSHATYLSFHLLVDLLAPWVREVAGTDTLSQLATVLESFAETAPTTERWSLLAFAREARDPESRGGPPIIPLAEALALALWRIAEGAPLVMVLEDLEWADAASLAVLDVLLPKLAHGPALILCTHHGDWSHEWPDIPRHAQLFLGPLSHSESLRMIASIAVERPLAPATAEVLAFAAEGNPLLLEQGTLAQLERDAPVAQATVPATLTDAVLARIAALPPTAREVLFAAAAIGPRFTYRAVAMVTEAVLPDRWAIDTALRELARRRLIVRWRGGPEVTYRFAHSLIQEIAYGALPVERRALLEARVADWVLSENALRGRAIARIVEDLDQRALQTPAGERAGDRVLGNAPKGGAAQPAPTSIDLRRRGKVLARIVLADRSADQRASLAFCLQHGYSYAEAAELLGLDPAEVRDHLYNARKLFKRLSEASALAPEVGQAGEIQ